MLCKRITSTVLHHFKHGDVIEVRFDFFLGLPHSWFTNAQEGHKVSWDSNLTPRLL